METSELALGFPEGLRNRMLSALSRPLSERLSHLPQGSNLVKADRDVQWVYFLDCGMAFVISCDASGALIEVGVIGREGIVGV